MHRADEAAEAGVPVAASMTSATMGFAAGHFRLVVTEGIQRQADIASAAGTLELTTRIAEQVLQAA